MNTFELHQALIDNYRSYLTSFLSIGDARIQEKVAQEFNSQGYLPEPLIQFNPAYATSKTLEELDVHPALPHMFGSDRLYRHQAEALELGLRPEGFVVTSGTGSGKSRTFLATIFDYLFRQEDKPKGVKAVLVYPMNALINSQVQEIDKYAEAYKRTTGKEFPFVYERYTGQESRDDKDALADKNPDIILTNCTT